jgi:cytochrome c-type biogenesis protein CcmH/NrfG
MYKKEPLPKEKHTNEELYRRQVETLKLLLSKHAITQAQFDKSYRDLTEKMQMTKSGGMKSVKSTREA